MASVVNAALPGAVPLAESDASRVRRAVEAHHVAVWRSLRRFGFDAAAADDGAQEVFCVFARRVREVEPGKEKSFLVGVALRVVRTARRTHARRPEVVDDEAVMATASRGMSPEEVLDERRALSILDRILDAMPLELREVLVLSQIEEMPMIEIAAALDVPQGTVASRLRRARVVFGELAQRAKEREEP